MRNTTYKTYKHTRIQELRQTSYFQDVNQYDNIEADMNRADHTDLTHRRSEDFSWYQTPQYFFTSRSYKYSYEQTNRSTDCSCGHSCHCGNVCQEVADIVSETTCGNRSLCDCITQ